VWRIVYLALLLALVAAAPAAGKHRRAKPIVPVHSDGQVGLSTARQVFAATIAPLPGVHPPKRGYPALHDGSGPVQWVLQHWAQLTAAQQAAVAKALPGIAVPGAPLRLAAPAGHAAALSIAQLEVMAEEARTRLNAHFNPPVTKPITVDTQPFASDTLDSLAYTEGGPMNSCRIVFTPAGLADTVAETRMTMLHEVTHCYQLQVAKDVLPAWLEEGSPEWVAAVVGAEWNGAGYHSGRIAGWWIGYFDTFEAPLTQRTYDAMPFFARLAESGANVFGTLSAMYQAQPSSAVYDMAVDPSTFAGTQLLGTLTSSGLRRPSLGPAWAAAGAMIPPASTARYNPATRVVPKAAPGLTVTAKPYSNAAFRIASKAEVVDLHVLSPGGAWGRLHAADGDHDLVPESFCASGDCTCPGGGEITPLGDQAHIALFGHKDGAAVRLAPTTRDEACGRKSTELNVTGAWTATFRRQGSCSVSNLGDPQTLSALFVEYETGGQVTLEIRRYTGPGTYRTGLDPPSGANGGPSRAAVVKFGEPGGGSWGVDVSADEPGTIRVDTAGPGGATGQVDTVSRSPGEPPTTVHVGGRWSCAPAPGASLFARRGS
jgi:hypothetical protein